MAKLKTGYKLFQNSKVKNKKINGGLFLFFLKGGAVHRSRK